MKANDAAVPSPPASPLHFTMWDQYLTALNTLWDLETLRQSCVQQAEEQQATTDFHGGLWHHHLLPLNQAWHVSAAFNLAPPASFLAKLLFPLKKLVVRWMQPLIDGLVQQQNDVNARLVQTCNAIVESVNSEAMQRLEAQKEFNSRLVQTINGLVEIVDTELRRKYEELRLMVWTCDRRKEALEIDEIRLNQKLEQVMTLLRTHPSETAQTAPPRLPDSERQADFGYVLFEHRYRGDEALLKQRQAGYLKYFEGQTPVVDMGCGRGEFLELLQEHHIANYGVDVNQVMLDYCRKKGLTVEESDVLPHLESLANDTLGGIFMAQMVEHYAPSQLPRLFQRCFEKLQPHAYLVIETQNPTSLYALSHFYRDPTHEKPVHPDALEFLLKSAGFQDVHIEYTSPFPQEQCLQELPEIGVPEEAETPLRQHVARINQNIRQLNAIVYGCLDYAVIAQKISIM